MGCSASSVIELDNNDKESIHQPKIVRACREDKIPKDKVKSISYLNNLIDENQLQKIHKKESSSLSLENTSKKTSKKPSLNSNNDELSVDLHKKQKKEILKKFEDIFEKEITDKNDIKVLYIHSYIFSKKESENLNISQQIKVSFIKGKEFSSWNKKPFIGIKKETDNFFGENKEIKDYYNYKYDKTLSEYEAFPEEDLLFTKVNPKTQKISKSKFNINIVKNKNILFLIFDIANENSLLFLQSIIEYQSNHPNLALIPVYGKEILSHNEPLYILEELEKQKIEIKEQNLYFLSESQPNKLKQYLPFISENEQSKIIPLVCIVDTEKRVRCIKSPEDFSIKSLEVLNIDKKKFVEDIDKITEVIKIDKSYTANLEMRKCTVYSYDPEKKELKKQIKIYEGINGWIDDIEIGDKIRDIEPFKSIKEPPTQNTSESEIKTIFEFVNRNTKDLSELLGINIGKYDIIQKTSKTLLSIPSDSTHKFDAKPNAKFCFEFKLETNLFDKNIQMSICSNMSSFYNYTKYGTLNYIGCLPQPNSPFLPEIKLYNSKTGKETTLSLIDKHTYNLIIVFSYYNNIFAIEELKYKLRKLEPYFSNESINIIPVFRGEPSDFTRLMKDMGDDNIIKKNKLEVLMITNNYISSFPLYFDSNGMENIETIFTVILTNKSNNTLYIGNLSDLKIKKLLKEISQEEEGNETESNETLSLNQFKMKINKENLLSTLDLFQKILEKELNGEDFVKPLNYRPYINILYDQRYSNNDVFYENVKINIVIKSHHIQIFKKSKELKEVIKKLNTDFNACILIIPLQCCELNISVYCNECGEEIPETDAFLYKPNNNNVYCLKCEAKLENQEGYFIYIKSKDFDNEIIEEFMDLDASIHDSIHSGAKSICDLCNGPLNYDMYISLTQFNVNVGLFPLCICPDCFSAISQNSQNISDTIKKNMNYFCVSQDNLIFWKKI